MTEENQRFLDILSGKIILPKGNAGYKNPYQDAPDKQLFEEMNQLCPGEEYGDAEKVMQIMDVMAERYFDQLTKRYE